MTTTQESTFDTGMFGDPTGGGDQWKAADHVGALVAFVQPSREEMTTKYGVQEATKCRYVVVLEGSGTAEDGSVFDEPIVFGNISRDAYSNGIDKIVLGRVQTGEAKAGQSAPYILDPASPEDKASAAAWFKAHASMNAAGLIVIK